MRPPLISICFSNVHLFTLWAGSNDWPYRPSRPVNPVASFAPSTPLVLSAPAGPVAPCSPVAPFCPPTPASPIGLARSWGSGVNSIVFTWVCREDSPACSCRNFLERLLPPRSPFLFTTFLTLTFFLLVIFPPAFLIVSFILMDFLITFI